MVKQHQKPSSSLFEHFCNFWNQVCAVNDHKVRKEKDLTLSIYSLHIYLCHFTWTTTTQWLPSRTDFCYPRILQYCVSTWSDLIPSSSGPFRTAVWLDNMSYKCVLFQHNLTLRIRYTVLGSQFSMIILCLSGFTWAPYRWMSEDCISSAYYILWTKSSTFLCKFHTFNQWTTSVGVVNFENLANLCLLGYSPSHFHVCYLFPPFVRCCELWHNML